MTEATARAEGSFIPEWTFAEKFRKARKIAGMEQREFAVALKLTPSTVAAYETGRATPRFRDAAPLAKRIQILTRVDYTWFLDVADPAPTGGGTHLIGVGTNIHRRAVGPAGSEATPFTVESQRLGEVLPFTRKAS